MQQINIKSFLTAGLIGSAGFVLSCGGGGASGNGFTQNGYYTLSANMAVANPPVYSVNPSYTIPLSPSSYSIPPDSWNVNINLTYNGSLSALSSTDAYITSASICFGDPTIPGGSCQQVPLKSYVFPLNSNITQGLTITPNYKLGALGLIANPYQDAPYSSSTIPLNVLSSTSLAYNSSFNLPSNISPGSVEIGFTAVYQVGSATGSSTSIVNTYSGTILVSSSTMVSNTSNTNIPSSYTVSGFCIDNGNGGFYQQASMPSASINITCSGSINYNTGVISNFFISLPPNQTFSSTFSSISSLTSSSTNTSSTVSSTTIVLSSTTSILSLSAGYINQNISAFYALLNGQTSGSYFSAYLPPPQSPILYFSLYYKPQYIIDGSNTIPCSYSTCQIVQVPSGYLLQIQNSFLSGTSVSAVVGEYITYNPSIIIQNHQPASVIPYTFYVNVSLPEGDNLSTSFSGAITIQSPQY